MKEALPSRRIAALAIGLGVACLAGAPTMALSAGEFSPGDSIGGGTAVERLPECTASNTGQTVFLRTAPMRAQGVTWRMRCDADSTSAYKWEFIGGPPLFAEVTADEALPAAVTTFTSPTTAGPSIKVPSGGDYTIAFGMRAYPGANTQLVYMGYALGSSPVEESKALVLDSPGGQANAGRTSRVEQDIPDETTINMRYRHSDNTQAANVSLRWMAITPVRLGYTLPVAPVNVDAPTITGVAQRGQSLRGTIGTWQSPVTPAYTQAWLRCDAAGGNCASIGGATALTYSPTPDDIASTLRLAVTATHIGGNATAQSAPTAVVTGAKAVNTALPVISGDAIQGETITTTDGTWDSDVTPSYAYQWLRCNASGAGCAPIAGATNDTHRIVADDVQSTLRVDVTATHDGGSTTARSGATAVVDIPTPDPPTVYGGSLDWSNAEAVTVTASSPDASYYQYRTSTDRGLTWSAPATGSSVEITDEGQTLVQFRTNYVDQVFSAWAPVHSGTLDNPDAEGTVRLDRTPASATIDGPAEIAAGSPGEFTVTFDETVSGIETEDFTTANANCTIGTPSAASGSSITITLDCTEAGTAGIELTPGSVVDRAGNASPQAAAASTQAVVSTEPPANTAPPTVAGFALTGNILTSADGTWSGHVSGTAYQWQRALPDSGIWSDITGATASTYTIADTDYGYELRVRVTKSNLTGEASEASTATPMVAARLVQALPADPEDGQLAVYQTTAMAAQGVAWEFMYNAASTSPYKWEFVGGAPMITEVSTQQTTATINTWLDLATTGPSYILPLTGTYDANIQAATYNNSGVDATSAIGLTIGAGSPGTSASVSAGSGWWMYPMQTVRFTNNAGSEARVRYWQNVNGFRFQSRVLEVTPVRVGS